MRGCQGHRTQSTDRFFVSKVTGRGISESSLEASAADGAGGYGGEGTVLLVIKYRQIGPIKCNCCSF